MKINLIKLMIALGYAETQAKSMKTRYLKSAVTLPEGTEASDVTEIDADGAKAILSKIATGTSKVKDKALELLAVFGENKIKEINAIELTPKEEKAKSETASLKAEIKKLKEQLAKAQDEIAKLKAVAKPDLDEILDQAADDIMTEIDDDDSPLTLEDVQDILNSQK